MVKVKDVRRDARALVFLVQITVDIRRVHGCQGQMFHGSEICWALTLVTDTSSTSSLININQLQYNCKQN